jgi:predicted phosphoribosyltransferase/dienelactone hydrolase
VTSGDVSIATGTTAIDGTLTVPTGSQAIVLFAHGTGSGRHSPRNRFVAQVLADAGLATLLMDLLTSEEELGDVSTGHLRFDIGLLAERVIAAVDWLEQRRDTAGLTVGCFGASTGAAAALQAASARPGRVAAVVSRGGRPDLAADALPLVQAPTLLIVGGRDETVITLNQNAADLLGGPVRLEIVPGATHLFEEAGALERVAELARDWFLEHLAASERPKGNPGDMPGAEAPFQDRADAGRQLGERLREYAGRDDVVALGLARGGVPVAREVARLLGAPLDVCLVRKLGTPGHEELAMGAIASGGVQVLNDEVVTALNLPEDTIAAAARDARRELERRERTYRDGRPPADVQNRTAIVIDDGLATGASMRAAVQALRERDAGRIVVAVPVAARETCAVLEDEVDEIVCVKRPEHFLAVGAWYRDFAQTSDEDVRRLLAG